MTTPTFTMGPAILFCPADRPERFAKAAERADAVILDLEDAVAPDAKPAAREHIAAADLDPATTVPSWLRPTWRTLMMPWPGRDLEGRASRISDSL